MKKRYLSYLLLVVFLGLWSCKSEDSVFEQTVDQRLNESLAAHQKELTDATYGWKGIIYPAGGGIYSFYFKFNDQNRVVMYSDFDTESAVTPKESSYRVKAIETPSLIFDTYSYLHVLADPDGNVNGGPTGDGLKSDFEFSFAKDTLNNGSITLTGTKNQSRLILTKATQEEAVAYGSGGLGRSLLFSNLSKYVTYFKRATIGGVQYEISVNQDAHTIKLTWIEGGTIKTFTTDYYHSSTGVVFLTPLLNGSQTINGFTDITWDATKLSLGLTAAGTKTIVVGAAKPLFVDVTAAKKWWAFAADKGSYWISLTGFTVEGKEDYFGVTNIADFNYILFFPAIASNSGTAYDAFAAYDGTDLMGPAVTPTFRTDGRITFSVVGTYGTNELLNGKVQDQVEEANGYYLVQTSDVTYDMVSAKDGKTWISWWYPWE